MAELTWRERVCPLCESNSYEQVADRDRRGRALRTVLCTGCGHVFTNPAPAPAELTAYYRDKYRQDYKDVSQPKRKHIYRAGLGALTRLAELTPHVPSGGKVIDVGAGGGEFVYLLSQRGFRASGIEPHAGYANHARNQYGIEVVAGTLETVEVSEGTADAVTLHHVLEHTAEPLAALRHIRAWLKDTGVLAVEVPNLASWAHAPGHRFHRAHLQTFNRTGLEDTLANAGFEIIQQGAPDGRGHLKAIARKAQEPTALVWRDVAPHSRSVLATHTPLAHILSGQPLKRIRANLSRPIREAAAIRALGNPASGRALLNALYARAQ
ncbi:MAG: class I SAM-dependent methyltransferase [Rhodospirillaceae bacterium]